MSQILAAAQRHFAALQSEFIVAYAPYLIDPARNVDPQVLISINATMLALATAAASLPIGKLIAGNPGAVPLRSVRREVIVQHIREGGIRAVYVAGAFCLASLLFQTFDRHLNGGDPTAWLNMATQATTTGMVTAPLFWIVWVAAVLLLYPHPRPRRELPRTATPG